MGDAVIELNDSNVTVTQSGSIVAGSPGIAVLKEDGIELGQAALQSTHMDPRNTFSRFWSNLNQDNFKQRTKLARHNADLAYAHLLSLHEMAGEVDRVIFAVPGSFTNSQLSLLLGLAEASPFTPVGLVDSAVAATAAMACAGDYNHLDIHLHHAVITSLKVSDTVSRTAVNTISDVGLLDIQDMCVNHIADLFIQQSRFDPLHHAATEQALCNRLAQCLQELETETDTMVEIELENTRYRARVNRERLVDALRPLYDKISAAVGVTRVSLVNKRLAGLPEFTDYLAVTSRKVEVLDEYAVFTGCMGNLPGDKFTDDEIYFATQLKTAAESAIAHTAAAASLEKKPDEGTTHVLVKSEAHSLGLVPLYLSAKGVLKEPGGEDPLCSLTLNGSIATLTPGTGTSLVFVNGRAVTGNTELKLGDVISSKDSTHKFTLIRVLA